MRDTNSGGCLVDLLTACTACTVNVHLNLVFAYLNVNIFIDFRHYFNGSKAGVAASGTVKGRYTDKSVYAVFALQIAVSVSALNQYAGALYACFFTVKVVEYGYFHTVLFCPVVVHTVKHLDPVLSLCTACACVECENRIIMVKFA